MRRLSVLIGLVVATGSLSLAPTAVAGPGGSDNGTACVLNTQLRPENEVRTGPVDPVDSTAKGHAQIKVRNDGTIEFDVVILNKAGEHFHIGHIHRGEPFVNGPIVVDLLGGPAGGEETEAEHIRLRGEGVPRQPAAGPNIAADICNNPAAYYVNFHTHADPQGAVRGQLG